MRKHVLPSVLALAVTVLLGVAIAGEPDNTTIQGGATVTEVINGQTIQLSSVGVNAEVEFYSVSENGVNGVARRINGGSGTVTIHWVEGSITTVVPLSPQAPEQLFGLEGGDGDKRSGGEVN